MVLIQFRREETREEIEVGGLDLSERVERLFNEGTDLIVCGAITNVLHQLLESRGIKVIPWVSGEIDDVISALANGGLPHERFLIPGCRQRMRGPMGVQKRKRGRNWKR